MQEKLIIFLNADDLSHPSWVVVDEANTLRQSATLDAPEGLSSIAVDKTVIVMVPAGDVLLTKIHMPPMNRTRLMKAVPFALEEQLIDDVDQLHFAIGQQAANGDLPVAVTALTKMQTWLSLLNTWGVAPHYLMSSVHALLSNEWPKVNEEFLPHEPYIIDAAKSVASEAAINLLQGSFAVKKSKMPKLPKLNHVFKMTAILAGVFIFLLFAYPIGSYFILSTQLNSIDKQIAAIYKRNFPQAKSVVAPKERMEAKLAKSTGDFGNNRLLILLGYVGKAMQQTANIQLKKCDYQNHQLTLELSAATSDNFSAFTDYLSRQGLSVKQQNANLNGARVNAVLVME